MNNQLYVCSAVLENICIYNWHVLSALAVVAVIIIIVIVAFPVFCEGSVEDVVHYIAQGLMGTPGKTCILDLSSRK